MVKITLEQLSNVIREELPKKDYIAVHKFLEEYDIEVSPEQFNKLLSLVFKYR